MGGNGSLKGPLLNNTLNAILVSFGQERFEFDSHVAAPVRMLGDKGNAVHVISFEPFWQWLGSFFINKSTPAFAIAKIQIRLPWAPLNILYFNSLLLWVYFRYLLFSGRTRINILANDVRAARLLNPLQQIVPGLRFLCGIQGFRAIERGPFQIGLAHREQTRASLNFQGRFVVVFSVIPEELTSSVKIATLFNLISEIEPGAFLFLATPEPEKVSYLFSGLLPEEKFLAKHVAGRDLPATLCACDMGLLIQDGGAPKFMEYLAAGLHVVASRSTREIVHVLESDRSGTLLDNLNDTGALRAHLLTAVIDAKDVRGRQARSTKSSERYDWQRFLPPLKKWYFGDL